MSEEQGSSFTIFIGGKPPDPVPAENEPNNIGEINRQAQAGNIDFAKWWTCKWKSGIEKRVIKSCCGRSEEVLTIACNKLEITMLTPLICARCSHHSPKDI